MQVDGHSGRAPSQRLQPGCTSPPCPLLSHRSCTWISPLRPGSPTAGCRWFQMQAGSGTCKWWHDLGHLIHEDAIRTFVFPHSLVNVYCHSILLKTTFMEGWVTHSTLLWIFSFHSLVCFIYWMRCQDLFQLRTWCFNNMLGFSRCVCCDRNL